MYNPIQGDDLHRDLPAVWSSLESHSAGSTLAEPGDPAGDPVFPHSLDNNQAAAASHYWGPMRVLAPAGSGKTRTLTARIAALQTRGVRPGSILALAFNAKAAEEMSSRLAETGVREVQSCTFHSLGYEIVRQEYGWKYSGENESRLNQLASHLLSSGLDMPVHPGQNRRVVEGGLKILREGKSDLLGFKQMSFYDGNRNHMVEEIFRKLITQQTRLALVTFSDMIYFAVRSLVENERLRSERQQRHAFILVDEFQDLNAAQMLFLRILALPQNNLFVVGDDDQLIYAWRGAQVRHILDFDSFYPRSNSVVLATNYRSGRRIVRHGRWLIENNPDRVAKDIRPARDAGPGKIEIKRSGSLQEQARFAIEWVIATKMRNSLTWGAFGLLVRTNRDAVWLSEELETREIPFTVAGEPEPDLGDPPPDISPDKVTLLTVHKAKGKEFLYVVYFNLCRRAGTGLTEADERRVVYVGVTRAKTGLLITADNGTPSQFLIEVALNPALSDYAEPFLLRKFRNAYRRRLWRKRKFRLLAASLIRPPVPKDNFGDIEDEEIELLLTELKFRAALDVSIQP